MILSFGAILMSIKMSLHAGGGADNVFFGSDYDVDVAGRAAIQAMGSVRAGSRTALIGCIGDDHYGKNILLRLRQNEIVTSGVARPDGMITGTAIEMGKTNTKTLIALGASAKAHHDQMPEEILDPSKIILIQDEFPYEQNAPILDKAQACGCRLILSAGVRGDFKSYDLDKLTYIVVLEQHKTALAYFKEKAANKLIVLLNNGGVESADDKGEKIILPCPALEGRERIDPTCADDAFIGAFAASISKAKPLRIALKRANMVRYLTACKHGGISSLPHPFDIDNALEEEAG